LQAANQAVKRGFGITKEDGDARKEEVFGDSDAWLKEEPLNLWKHAC